MTGSLIETLIGDFKELLAAMATGHIRTLPLLDNLYDGVTITDAAGKIFYINKVQLSLGT